MNRARKIAAEGGDCTIPLRRVVEAVDPVYIIL